MALKVVLKEQIERNEKNKAFYNKKLSTLPKGSIHVKIINGNPYHYLKFRDEGGKRVDQYVRADDLAKIKEEILKRKKIEQMIRDLDEDIKIAKKAIGSK